MDASIGRGVCLEEKFLWMKTESGSLRSLEDVPAEMEGYFCGCCSAGAEGLQSCFSDGFTVIWWRDAR